MNFVNFGTFETRSPLLTSDFLVGYKQSGPTEIKTQIKDVIDLLSTYDKDKQILSFNENTKALTISNGNTVVLSGLSDANLTTFLRSITGKYEITSTIVEVNSAAWSKTLKLFEETFISSPLFLTNTYNNSIIYCTETLSIDVDVILPSVNNNDGDTIRFIRKDVGGGGTIRVRVTEVAAPLLTITTNTVKEGGTVIYREETSTWEVLPVDKHTHTLNDVVGLITQLETKVNNTFVEEFSGNWQGTYTTVRQNSASWSSGSSTASFLSYLSTNQVTVSSLNVLDNLIVLGTLSAVSISAINVNQTTTTTSTSSLEVSGTLNVLGPILSSNTNLKNIFVTNYELGQLSGSFGTNNSELAQISSTFVTDFELTQTLRTYVQSNSSLETPSTNISAVQNIVAMSQANYNALTVKLPTTLYVIV
jgi:hypothetical protein